jgi:hypothetical protein
MNTLPFNNQAFQLLRALSILHKQAKFLVGFVRRSSPWAFFVANTSDEPNCNVVQQMKCSFCYPHEVPQSQFDKKTKGKKRICAYNKSFGTSALK